MNLNDWHEAARIIESGTPEEREAMAGTFVKVAKLTPSTAHKLKECARVILSGSDTERQRFAANLKLNSGRAGGPSTKEETT
jgi:hypothetical protein